MATKGQIRSTVIEVTGRQDLTENMYNDVTKFDFFLNSALKLLDTAQKTPESKRWLKKDIAIGDHSLNFQNARVIHEVWMSNADGRYELEKKTLNWIMSNYGDPDDTDVTTGTPLYYGLDVIHLSPQQRTLGDALPPPGEFTYNYSSILFKASYGYNGIVWYPPTDVVYTVDILADFYSVLDSDGDSNYWSVQYPNVLVQAVCFAIEVFYRNTAGMRDYLESLRPFLQGIDFNLAEQDAMNINQMEG